jgi:hypothetical protein
MLHNPYACGSLERGIKTCYFNKTKKSKQVFGAVAGEATILTWDMACNMLGHVSLSILNLFLVLILEKPQK